MSYTTKPLFLFSIHKNPWLLKSFLFNPHEQCWNTNLLGFYRKTRWLHMSSKHSMWLYFITWKYYSVERRLSCQVLLNYIKGALFHTLRQVYHNEQSLQILWQRTYSSQGNCASLQNKSTGSGRISKPLAISHLISKFPPPPHTGLYPCRWYET